MLVRLRGDADQWLLIKEKDQAARPDGDDLLAARPESVLSGRTLEDLAADRARPPGTPACGRRRHEDALAPPTRPARRRGAAVARSRSPAAEQAAPSPAELPQARRAACRRTSRRSWPRWSPRRRRATRWIHEVKFDGYRALCYLEAGAVRFVTRGGQDWTERFPGPAAAVAAMAARQALLDGELVALLPDGRSSFEGLQQALSTHRRRGRAAIVPGLRRLRPALPGRLRPAGDAADRAQGRPAAAAGGVARLLSSALQRARRRSRRGLLPGRLRAAPGGRGLQAGRRRPSRRPHPRLAEGEVPGPAGVRRRRLHRPGRLARRHRRAPAGRTHEGAAGLLPARSAPASSSATCSTCGGGWPPWRARSRRSATTVPRAEARGAHWVKPAMVVEVRFSDWTSDGRLRHPSFQGVREDKPAGDVVREGGRRRPATAQGAGGARQWRSGVAVAHLKRTSSRPRRAEGARGEAAGIGIDGGRRPEPSQTRVEAHAGRRR